MGVSRETSTFVLAAHAVHIIDIFLLTSTGLYHIQTTPIVAQDKEIYCLTESKGVLLMGIRGGIRRIELKFGNHTFQPTEPNPNERDGSPDKDKSSGCSLI